MAAALAFLFVLHSAILEPDFHLFLGQVQVCGDLDAPQSGQVHVRGELSLQLQKLCAGEGGAHALAALKFAVAVFCENKMKNEMVSHADIIKKQVKCGFVYSSALVKSNYSPMEIQWNCRGSGTEYAA